MSDSKSSWANNTPLSELESYNYLPSKQAGKRIEGGNVRQGKDYEIIPGNNKLDTQNTQQPLPFGLGV